MADPGEEGSSGAPCTPRTVKMERRGYLDTVFRKKLTCILSRAYFTVQSGDEISPPVVLLVKPALW